MDLLKKGIVFGLGIHDMSKKQIEDFAKKLYASKLITKEQAKELSKTILKRKRNVTNHINSRIENLVQTALQKEELATISHIEYLEKRIDLLEDELYNLLLDKYIDDVDDDEIAELLKDLDLDKDILEPKKKSKKAKQNVPSDDLLNNTFDLDDSLEELDDLLSLPKEDKAKKVVKRKKTATKKKATKKKAAAKKKATTKKKATKRRVAPKKKVVKKKVTKKKVATKKKSVTKKKTTKKKAVKEKKKPTKSKTTKRKTRK